MARRFAEPKLLVATHNAGKLDELRGLLGGDVGLVSAGELSLPEPVEDGHSFVANARIKAYAAMRASGLPTLADDSGLEAAGLDGAPGVDTALWQGPKRSAAVGMARLRDALIERYGSFAAANTAARFVCVLCLLWPDGHEELFEGTTAGTLVDPPRGAGGHGFDPMFVPEGHALTFAEMEPAAKNALSHRGRALAALRAACFAQP